MYNFNKKAKILTYFSQVLVNNHKFYVVFENSERLLKRFFKRRFQYNLFAVFYYFERKSPLQHQNEAADLSRY